MTQARAKRGPLKNREANVLPRIRAEVTQQQLQLTAALCERKIQRGVIHELPERAFAALDRACDLTDGAQCAVRRDRGALDLSAGLEQELRKRIGLRGCA